MSWKNHVAGDGQIVLEWEYQGVECIVVKRTKFDEPHYCAYAHIYRDDLYNNYEIDVPALVTYANSDIDVVGIDSGLGIGEDPTPEDIRQDIEELLDEVLCSECSNVEYKHGYCEECINESPENVLASEI